MKFVILSLLAIMINGTTVFGVPQTKLVIVNCVNKSNTQEKFQMTASIVFAPNSVQQTSLHLNQQTYNSNGEYEPSGEFYHSMASGTQEEIFVSWGIMKTGAGDMVLHPNTGRERHYSCQPTGYQG